MIDQETHIRTTLYHDPSWPDGGSTMGLPFTQSDITAVFRHRDGGSYRLVIRQDEQVMLWETNPTWDRWMRVRAEELLAPLFTFVPNPWEQYERVGAGIGSVIIEVADGHPDNIPLVSMDIGEKCWRMPARELPARVELFSDDAETIGFLRYWKGSDALTPRSESFFIFEHTPESTYDEDEDHDEEPHI